MKKLNLFGCVLAAFFLSQSFVTSPTPTVEKKPDWLIKIDKTGIQVVDDGKNCIEITVEVPSFYAFWSNCKE